jgi:hypothetical protein
MNNLYERLQDHRKVGLSKINSDTIRMCLSSYEYWTDVTYCEAQIVCEVLNVALVDFRNIFKTL